MGLLKWPVALLLATTLFASAPHHALYLMRQGQVERSIEAYHNLGDHDFDLLRALATQLLATASTPEEELLAVYGAGIAADPGLMPILQNGLFSENPQTQVAAIHLLAALNDDIADDFLLRALGSPYLITRLEALLQLAIKQHDQTIPQLNSLIAKVPPQLHPLFPQLYVLTSTPEANQQIKRFLADRSLAVRRATILALAATGRDDFLPEMERLARQLDPLLQEAAAVALGQLRATDNIERLANSPHTEVRIAALTALEDYQTLSTIDHPLATFALSNFPEAADDLVYELPDTNAAIALLLLHDERATDTILQILTSDDLYIYQTSASGALGYIKEMPLPTEEYHTELSTRLKEALLYEASHLSTFPKIATALLASRNRALIPTLISLLESSGEIELLKSYATKPGDPLVRAYCTLSLVRQNEADPEPLVQWLRLHQSEEILLRPLPPSSTPSLRETPHTLTPTETARLLIESYETLAQRQDQLAVDTLLDAIANGNPANRYALAGLLLRILQ